MFHVIKAWKKIWGTNLTPYMTWIWTCPTNFSEIRPKNISSQIRQSLKVKASHRNVHVCPFVFYKFTYKAKLSFKWLTLTHYWGNKWLNSEHREITASPNFLETHHRLPAFGIWPRSQHVVTEGCQQGERQQHLTSLMHWRRCTHACVRVCACVLTRWGVQIHIWGWS